MADALFLGLDIGTGGVRGSVIDDAGAEQAWHSVDMPAPVTLNGQVLQDAIIWQQASARCLQELAGKADLRRLRAIAVDATSSSILLCRDDGAPMTAASMYNDSSSQDQAALIADIAPKDCGAHGASSSLAKALQLRERYPDLAAAHLCHQADFINGWLCGRFGISDENNCLKLGYDSRHRRWPDWLQHIDIPAHWLPQVVAAGTKIGPIRAELAAEFNIADDCIIVAGTTDSLAAVLATGADRPGDGITSLGSTLVIKLICTQPVFSAEHGIYSHRFPASTANEPDLWLAGGASNCGGQVLTQLFNQQQLDTMTPQLRPGQPTGLRYTPLPLEQIGERFPLADTECRPKLSPRPDDDVMFFQGILESLTEIEAQGYALLQQLGAGELMRVFTTGGGGRNAPWQRMREQRLGKTVYRARRDEAAYGAALLARHGIQQLSHP